MVAFEQINFNRISFSAAIYYLMVVTAECRPVNEPGTITRTQIVQLPFFNQVVNPCGVTPDFAVQNNSVTTTAATGFAKIHTVQFYQSMETALKESSLKLGTLVTAEPSLPQCNGITLDSLPGTPSLQNMNIWETTKQAYKTMIFLTTHFHLMALDRQKSVSGDTPVIRDDLLQPDESVPAYRYQRCGNESDSFPGALRDITSSLENILCVILSAASDEQTTSLREPLNSLQATVLYRYHKSCSTLQTRDCLVVREAENSLRLLSDKYQQLIQQASLTNGAPGDLLSHHDDFLDNSI